MTRREWLKLNPPPKAAGTLRERLEELTTQTAARAELETRRGAWQQSVIFWNQESQRAISVGDMVKRDHANAQLGDAQKKLADADKQLAATAHLPTRIAELTAELAKAARCSAHNRDLHRHRNRPEDLFLCDVGPHFYLWTKNGVGAALAPCDLSKPIPDLDAALEWI